MRPLTLADLPSVELFARHRERWRSAVIAHKERRRVAVGPSVTLLFEDRETLRWQVLEMARVERRSAPDELQHELDVYNELVPGPDELSATLFIEITEPGRIRPELDRLIGLDACVSLRAGDERVRARFDERQLEADRISAVHYLRFPLSPAARRALLQDAGAVSIEIDHPNYAASATLSPETRASLARDLTDATPPLIPPDLLATAAAPADEPELLRRGRVRAYRPASPRAPHHAVVEAVGATVPFAELPADWVAELMGVAQELAGALRREHGRARVSIDADAVPARADVFVPR